MKPTVHAWSVASSRMWERGKKVTDRDEHTVVEGMIGRSTGDTDMDEGDTEMYVDTAANGSIMKK